MTLTTKALRRNYDQLDALERFRLAAAAYQREDKAELDALHRTAPTKIYRMPAAPYGEMFEALQAVAWAAVTDVLRDGLYMGFAWATRVGDGLPSENDHGPDDHGRDWWAIGAKRAERVLATWAGLGLFCEELGITLDQALAHAPAVDDAKMLVDWAQHFADLDADLGHQIACNVGKLLPDQEADALIKEREHWITTRRANDAREVAANLRRLWDLGISS